MYFTIQFSSILSDFLRIKHFDLQKLSLITLNYWGYTFPLYSSSDSYCKRNCRVLKVRIVFLKLLFFYSTFSTFCKKFFISSKKENSIAEQVACDSLKFNLRISVVASETSQVFAATYPVCRLQTTQLSLQRYRGALMLRWMGQYNRHPLQKIAINQENFFTLRFYLIEAQVFLYWVA